MCDCTSEFDVIGLRPDPLASPRNDARGRMPDQVRNISKKIMKDRNSACSPHKSLLYSALSRPTKGALRNVNNAGRDAVDARSAADESAFLRTEKTCGPGTPMLVSSSR